MSRAALSSDRQKWEVTKIPVRIQVVAVSQSLGVPVFGLYAKSFRSVAYISVFLIGF
jgi:hypothetical protein